MARAEQAQRDELGHIIPSGGANPGGPGDQPKSTTENNTAAGSSGGPPVRGGVETVGMGTTPLGVTVPTNRETPRTLANDIRNAIIDFRKSHAGAPEQHPINVQQSIRNFREAHSGTPEKHPINVSELIHSFRNDVRAGVTDFRTSIPGPSPTPIVASQVASDVRSGIQSEVTNARESAPAPEPHPINVQQSVKSFRESHAGAPEQHPINISSALADMETPAPTGERAPIASGPIDRAPGNKPIDVSTLLSAGFKDITNMPAPSGELAPIATGPIERTPTNQPVTPGELGGAIRSDLRTSILDFRASAPESGADTGAYDSQSFQNRLLGRERNPRAKTPGAYAGSAAGAVDAELSDILRPVAEQTRTKVSPHVGMVANKAGYKARAKREKVYAKRAQAGLDALLAGNLPTSKQAGALAFEGGEFVEQGLF
ncbi:MAG: hypothetical protein ACNS61_05675, partial [Candidatus Wenzhouxiangella sp. M2_3B_020]